MAGLDVHVITAGGRRGSRGDSGRSRTRNAEADGEQQAEAVLLLIDEGVVDGIQKRGAGPARRP